jgi:sugar phosphate isomerase/epimerase
MNRRSFLSLAAALPAFSLFGQNAASPDFATLPVGGMDKKQAAAFAAAGYGYLELFLSTEIVPGKEDEVFAKNLAVLKGLPIPTTFLNGFITGDIPMVGPDAQHDKVEKWVRTAFPRARQLGVGIVTVGSGGSRRCPKDFDPAKARAQFSQILGRVAPIARDNGIRLTIENLNTAETNLCTSIAESVEVITAAGPDVYLTADIYHMMRDDDPAAELRKAKGRLIHCHVAEKELRSAPGTKGDDFRPHLRVLREMGYAGAFSFECGWAKSVSPDKAIAAFRQQLGTL